MNQGIHYMPVLKTKKGEFDAICDLFTIPDPRVNLASMLPLFQVANSQSLGEEWSSAYEKSLVQIADRILDCWGYQAPFLLDGPYMLDSTQHDGWHPMYHLCNRVISREVRLVPVTGLDRSTLYQTAIKGLPSNKVPNIAIRLLQSDLAKPTLAIDLINLITAHGKLPEQVHIIIDFKYLTAESPPYSYSHICELIPSIERWLTFTILGGAFPKDLTNCELGRNTIPRLEWVQWKEQSLGSALARKPSFGDYGIQHPIYDPYEPGRQGTASIRYTIDKEWVVMRGQKCKPGPSGPDAGQYIGHSILLVRTGSDFYGGDFSKGDQYILECSQEANGPGNATKWVEVGFNHHITLVLDQISNFAVPGAVLVPTL